MNLKSQKLLIKENKVSIPLIPIIDTDVMHSFISHDCVRRLNLKVYFMRFVMTIDTLASGSIATTLVCLNCHLSIYSRDFGVDFIYLPLSQLDVIMGMN